MLQNDQTYFKNLVVFTQDNNWQQVTIIFKSYYWIISSFIGCALNDAKKWNMFVMIINISNNEKTATLSIYTNRSYWWKHDGF